MSILNGCVKEIKSVEIKNIYVENFPDILLLWLIGGFCTLVYS